MDAYTVTVEVEGVVYVEVVAVDENEACRMARRLAELGEGTPNLTYEAVTVAERAT